MDQASEDRPIVLDTHVWIWLMEGDGRLSRSGGDTEAERAATSGLLYVSAISLWEVAMLEALRRLRLTIPVVRWLSDAARTPGLTVVGVDEALAAESAQLPGEFRGDGCDRLIVATARLNDATLMTADPALIEYASLGHLRVMGIS